MRRFLAGVLATVLVTLLAPLLWLRPKTRRGARARLGRPAVDPAAWPGRPRLWVHAASAGDVKNAWPVAARLRELRPDLAVILSVVTNSGEEMAHKLSPPPDATTYLPLDAPPYVQGTLDRLRPDLLLLECAELWPTLVHQAAHRGVPVAVVNGRLDARKMPSYKRFFALVGNPVGRLAAVCAQGEGDRARFVSLGLEESRCHVAGNCKFDAAARVPDQAKVEALRAALGKPGRLLVVGSTHTGEERVVLNAFLAAREVAPDLKLLWAPRYADHVAGLAGLCQARGLRAARRSAGPDGCREAEVLLLDTMGELAAAYALGTLAMVGGSWVPRGGQNILEPAAQGLPVVHGPHMFLSADQAAALDGHGASRVEAGEVGAELVGLLRHPEKAARRGSEGRAVVQGLAGAVGRHVAVLLPLLRKPGAP
jgi:3-deoxy-D-manno-octulosonic-acid transferase